MKKRKILLSLLASTMLLSACTVLLTACTHEHSWGEWTIDTAATCTESGERSHSCTSCHETESETIEALGHSYSAEWTFDETKHYHVCPVCSTNGSEAEHTMVDQECSICGYEIATANLTYTLNFDGTGYIVSGENVLDSETLIRIPAMHENLPVTAIADDAFISNTTIQKVYIPDSVTHIGSQAFRYCTAFTDVSLGKGITNIDRFTFAGCPTLEKANYAGDILSWLKIDFANNSSNPLLYAKELYIDGKLVTDVVVPDGITEIKTRAFVSYDKLKSVVIPNGVTSIGINAFAYCDNLETATLPDSITTIEESAFYDCTSLKSISIPKSLVTIGETAFTYCESMTGNLDLPATLTSIGDSAFSYCKKLTGNLVIPSGVTSIPTQAFNGCSSLTGSLVIPETVNSIGEDAFSDCGGFTGSLVIPNSITSISEGAFSGCFGLTSIVLHDNVDFVDSYAFYGCFQLKELTFGNKITNLDSSTFFYCTALTRVNYTGSLADWCNIEFGNDIANPLYYAHDLYIDGKLVENLVIPDGVTEIGQFQFINSSIKSITFAASVAKICESAFEGCIGLTGTLTIPSTLKTIGYRAFNQCSNISRLAINSGVEKIDFHAFYNCVNLTGNITIPDGVTYIGNRAFGNTDISGVTLPESLTDIYYDTFYGCDNMTFNEYEDAYYLGSGDNDYYYYLTPKSTSATTYKIHESTKVIGSRSFSGIIALTHIEIPATITAIGEYAFTNCDKLVEVKNLSALDIVVDTDTFGDVAHYAYNVYTPQSGESKLISSGDYEFYNNDGKYYLLGYSGTETNLVLPDNINGNSYTIYDYAFSGNADLTSVVIPAGVTAIGDYAFASSERLVEVRNLSALDIVAGANTHGMVGRYAKHVYTTSGESQIVKSGDYTFLNDGGKYYLVGYTGTQTDLILPEKVNDSGYEIYQNVFYENTNIKSVVIPDTVTAIGDSAFQRCTSLSSVTLGNGITTIEGYAFWSCNLKSISIPASLTYMDSPFQGNDLLESITVAAGNTVYKSIQNCLIEIETKTLIMGCKNSVIPDDGSVEIIGEGAFSNCVGLTTVIIPDCITKIEYAAFIGCRDLTSVTIGSGIDEIPYSTFAYCTSLVSATFKNTTGWRVVTDTQYLTGMALDVTDPKINVGYLMDDFPHLYLMRG